MFTVVKISDKYRKENELKLRYMCRPAPVTLGTMFVSQTIYESVTEALEDIAEILDYLSMHPEAEDAEDLLGYAQSICNGVLYMVRGDNDE